MCRCLICQSGGVEFIKIVLRFWPKQLEYSSTMVAATGGIGAAVASTGRAACSEDSGDRAMASETSRSDSGIPWAPMELRMTMADYGLFSEDFGTSEVQNWVCPAPPIKQHPRKHALKLAFFCRRDGASIKSIKIVP